METKIKSKWLLLLRLHLAGMINFNKFTHPADKKERRNAILMTCIIGFSCLTLCGYMGGMAYGYTRMGLTDTIPMLMMALSSVFTLFTVLFKSSSMLFGFEDYDMIMSLPVKVSEVVLSRVLAIYLFNIPFILGVMLPAIVVYCVYAAPAAMFYVYFILSLLFIPMLPVVAGVLLSVLVTYVSARVKFRNLIVTLLYLALFLGIMAVSFLSPSMDVTQITSLSLMVNDGIRRFYVPSVIYNTMLTQYSILSFIYFTAISAGSFAAFLWLFIPFYPKLSSLLAARATHTGYKTSELKASDTRKSLYRRELKRYLSSPIYMFNTAFGPLMMILGAIGFLFMDEAVLVPPLKDMAAPLLPYVFCMMIGMSCTTCSSISMEGKHLWILMTSPVSVLDIFWAKIKVNLTITVIPTILCAFLFRFRLDMGAADTLILFVMPLIFCFLSAVVGILINLWLPKYDWTNEAVVVKQSAAVMVSVFGSMAVGALPILSVFLLGDKIAPTLLAAGWTLVFAAAFAVCAHGMSKAKINQE